MDNHVMVTKILIVFAIALGTSYSAGLLLGEERKNRWFKKRTKASFFLRRGIFGEACHFGYPCTKEGFLIAAAMVFITSLLSYVFVG